MTEGLDVLGHEVIAAMTTAPWPRLSRVPLNCACEVLDSQGPPHGAALNLAYGTEMRAQTLSHVDNIKQSLALLRRHL